MRMENRVSSTLINPFVKSMTLSPYRNRMFFKKMILFFTIIIFIDINLNFKVSHYRNLRRAFMKQNDLDYFKKYLNNQLNELLSQVDDTVSGMTTVKDNFPDPTDRASLESDRNFMLRIRDRESKLIKKIKKALECMENGTFGICESCGGEISIKRLKARPVTTLCIDCKTKEEALEKALGL